MPHPSPPLHSKLGSLLFPSGSSNSGATLHEGVGREKAFILLINLQLAKTSERPPV